MRKKSIIIAIFILFYDQIIKYILNKSFYYGEIKSIIGNFFYVTKVYNDGAAWSSFSGGRIFLIIFSIVALIFLVWLQKSFKENTRTNIAFGLIYGGLLGNLVDRIWHGYVIDYLKFTFASYEFPIFNLADVALVIGFVILAYAIIKKEDKHED